MFPSLVLLTALEGEFWQQAMFCLHFWLMRSWMGTAIRIGIWRSSLEHWSKRPRPLAPEPEPMRLLRVPPSMPELISVVSPA
jgi:hypothetical protein